MSRVLAASARHRDVLGKELSSGTGSPPCGTPTKPIAPPGRVEASAWPRTRRAHAFKHRVCQHSPQQLAHLRRGFLAAFGDHIGGPEFAGQRRPVGMPGHGDDPGRPDRLAASTPLNPTAPSPTTTTLRPGATLAPSAAWCPVPMTSESASRTWQAPRPGCLHPGPAPGCHRHWERALPRLARRPPVARFRRSPPQTARCSQATWTPLRHGGHSRSYWPRGQRRSPRP